jgi:hypothetical protein
MTWNFMICIPVGTNWAYQGDATTGTCMAHGGNKKLYKVFIGKFRTKRSLRISRTKCKDDIKMGP